MLKSKILVVAALLTLGAPLAQTQFVEIVGSYLINKALADGQKREFPAAAIYCNVYYRERGGKLTQLQGWNTAAGVQACWSDNVVLQPILIINGSKSPREVQWALQDPRGPVRKIQYNPVKGGKRGKEGQAADNSGYKFESPLIEMRDMPYGWFAISASAGDGISATVVAQHLDARDIIAAMGREDIKSEVWAGAGTAMSPATPVFLARMSDGSIRPFMSQQELEMALAGQNAKPASPARQTLPFNDPPNSVEVNVPASSFEVRTHLYDLAKMRTGDRDRTRSELSSSAARNSPELSAIIPIPLGSGQALLVIHPNKFTAELVSVDGKLIKSYPAVRSEFGGKTSYSVMVTLANDGGSPMTNQLILRSGSERRVITFTGGERQ